MQSSDAIVYVVDDDLQVREAIHDLLTSYGMRVSLFASAAEYIATAKPDTPSCLILDIELPDINGLELQRRLAGARHPPIVFITGHGDVPGSVRAMKAGAVDFLPKPFKDRDLLAAIESALSNDRRARTDAAELELLSTRFASLTRRERDVLPLVVSGMLNKQAASQLGISLVTLQIHRARILRKMGAHSLSDLVRMSTKLRIPVPVAARPGHPDRTGHG